MLLLVPYLLLSLTCPGLAQSPAQVPAAGAPAAVAPEGAPAPIPDPASEAHADSGVSLSPT